MTEAAVASVAQTVRRLNLPTEAIQAAEFLAEHLEVTHGDWLRRGAARVGAIAERVGWLKQRLTAAGGPLLLNGLRTLAAEPRLPPNPPGLHGLSSEASLFLALNADGKPAAGIEQLRGVLVLGALEAAGEARLLREDARALARIIRGAAGSRGTPAQRALALLADVVDDSAAAFARRFAAALAQRASGAEIDRLWRQKWLPWLLDQRPAATKPPKGPGPKGVKPYKPAPYDGTGTVGGKPIDPAIGPEPPGESGPEVPAVPPPEPSRPEKPSVREQYAAAGQRIRTANLDLHRQHAEVISDVELRWFAPELLKRIASELEAGDVAKATLGLHLLLSLLTAMPADRAGNVVLVNRHAPGSLGPSISSEERTLRQPVLQIEGLFTPATEHLHLYEPVAPFLDLPLPADAVKTIERFPRGVLFDLLSDESKADVEAALRKYLADFDDPRSRWITPARIRRRLATEIQTATGDLATTMLICRDTMGRSTAPGFYYAPRSRVLREAYANRIWPIFGSPPPKLPGDGTRVGAPGLLTKAAAVSIVAPFSSALNLPKPTAGNETLWLSRVHNRLVDYCLIVIQCMTGHRPTNALFELTRWDFDLVTHSGLLSDKRIDAAHLRRLVATLAQVSAQIRLYLSHLKALASDRRCPPALKKRCQGAIDGSKPLFFCVTEELLVREGTLADYIAALPAAIREHPNWYRTFLATRLRELGAHGLAVIIQMGHLEAAGRPFQQDSGVVPLEVAKHLAPKLENLWRELGLEVRKGLAPGPLDPFDALPPLRSWEEAAAAHRAACRAAQQAARQALRARRHEATQAAEPHVMSALETVAPLLAAELAKLLKGERRDNVDKTASRELSADQLVELLEILDFDEPGTVAKISRHNVLSRWLGKARNKLDWKTPDLRLWMPAPGAEPTPFLQEAMLARTQILHARRFFSGVAKTTEPKVLLARTIVGLILHSHLSLDRILAIVNGKSDVTRVAALQDAAFLTPDGDALRGLAALELAVGKMKEKRKEKNKDETPPELPERALDTLAASFVPRELVGASEAGLLRRLASTAAVNRAFEESPLARLAVSDRGSATLDASLTIRALERRTNSEPHEPSVAPIVEPSEAPMPVRALRSLYRKLMNVLHMPKGKEKTFERTKVVIKASNVRGKKARKAMDAELKAFEAEQVSQPTAIYWLTRFARQLLAREQRPLKVSSIQTYISALGQPFANADMAPELSTMDGDEFTDLYVGVVDRFSGKSAARAALQCLRFHELLQKELGVPPFDRSQLSEYFADQESGVDVHLVTESECDKALEMLLASCRFDDVRSTPDHAALRRLSMAAAVALVLLRAAGLRASEVGLLLFEDLLLDASGGTLFLRPSGYGWLKSAAATRVIWLDGRLSPSELQLLKDWMAQEQVRLGGAYEHGLPMFGLLQDPSTPIPFENLRRHLLETLRMVCGREVKLHHCRHLCAARELLAATNCDSAFDSYPFRRLELALTPFAVTAEVRRVAFQLGHRDIATTVRSYFHLPWALARNSAANDESVIERWSLAAASNGTVGAIDKVRLRDQAASKGARAWLCRVLDTKLPCRPAPDSGEPGPPVVLSLPTNPFTAADLYRLLEGVSETADLPDRCRSTGLSDRICKAIAQALEDLNALCRYRLVALETRKGRVAQAPVPRQPGRHNPFIGLLEAAGRTDNELAALGDMFTRTYRASDGAELVVSQSEAKALKRALETETTRPVFTVQATPETEPTPRREVRVSVVSNKGQLGYTKLLFRALATVWVHSRIMAIA